MTSSSRVITASSVSRAASRQALVVVALGVGTMSLSACSREHAPMIHVIAEKAPGLKADARVRYRGVDVGHVDEVYFTPGGVRIDLMLERADVPIRVRDTVRIASIGPFAEQVVDIQAGDQTAALIARGATLPNVRPESTVALPVELWRSLVRAVSPAADSAADSVAATAIVTPNRSTP